MTRKSVDVMTSYCIITGLLSKGMSFHGPFNTFNEARSYGDKNFPNDTREVVTMYREMVTHEHDTSD